MWPNPQEIADSIICTEEIFEGKLHALFSDDFNNLQAKNQKTTNFVLRLNYSCF